MTSNNTFIARKIDVDKKRAELEARHAFAKAEAKHALEVAKAEEKLLFSIGVKNIFCFDSFSEKYFLFS